MSIFGNDVSEDMIKAITRLLWWVNPIWLGSLQEEGDAAIRKGTSKDTKPMAALMSDSSTRTEGWSICVALFFPYDNQSKLKHSLRLARSSKGGPTRVQIPAPIQGGSQKPATPACLGE